MFSKCVYLCTREKCSTTEGKPVGAAQHAHAPAWDQSSSAVVLPTITAQMWHLRSTHTAGVFWVRQIHKEAGLCTAATGCSQRWCCHGEPTSQQTSMWEEGSNREKLPCADCNTPDPATLRWQRRVWRVQRREDDLEERRRKGAVLMSVALFPISQITEYIFIKLVFPKRSLFWFQLKLRDLFIHLFIFFSGKDF